MQQTMYPGLANSPQTELASAIDNVQATITLVDATKVPAAPNLVTIGSDETAETVTFTGVSGNNLTGVTRGVEGTAKAWSVGSKVARNFTAKDYDTARQNIDDLNVSKSSKLASVGEVNLATMAETSIASYTPTAAGNFLVWVYLRVITGTTTMTVKVTYADATGAQTTFIINAQVTAIGRICPIDYTPTLGEFGVFEKKISKSALTRYAGSAESLFQAVTTDKQAAKVVEEFVTSLSIAIANMVNLLNPEKVMIGGVEVAPYMQPVLPRIQSAVAQFTPIQTIVELSHMGEESGALGIISFAFDKEQQVI
jgi:hypothetical protein